MEKIAILGCGYVGSAVGGELVRLGRQVQATATTSVRVTELAARRFMAVVWQAGDVAPLRRLIQDQDAVVLCVAPGGRGQDYREVYLRAVESLVAALPGSRVRRIVYTCSTRVYGQDTGEWVDEASPTVPRDENGRVLLEAENLLLRSVRDLALSERRELTATVLRLSGIYGPGRNPEQRVVQLAGQARDDGEEWVNLIHRDDIVAAIIALLEVGHHGALNLSDDQPTLRREYYDRLLASAGATGITWVPSAAGAWCGKRVRNAAIKGLLDLHLKHPRH